MPLQNAMGHKVLAPTLWQDVLYGCEMQRHRLEQEVGQLTRGIKTEEEDLVKAVAAARQVGRWLTLGRAASRVDLPMCLFCVYLALWS